MADSKLANLLRNDNAWKGDADLAAFNHFEAQAEPWYNKALPMEGRDTFLPFKYSQPSLPNSVMNQREWALPKIIAGPINAFTSANRAYTGADPTFNPQEEAMNLAGSVFGGGVGTSRAMTAPTGMGGKDLFMAGAKSPDIEYRGSHAAPNAEKYGSTLDNLTGIMPKDVYSSKGISLYGLNDPLVDREWFSTAYRAKDKPDAEVTIWRAVPKGVKDINSGDWVTTSKTYAKNHGENTLNGEYELISTKVKANTLTSEGYPYEFGYNAPRPALSVEKSDASNIFGQGAQEVRYTDPNSGGFIKLVQRPDGTTSILGLEVPKDFQGTGIGTHLQQQALKDYPQMQGQYSSKAAATNAYKLGNRPVGNPDAKLKDILNKIDEDSSIYLVSPELQKTLTTPSRKDVLTQQIDKLTK